MVQVRWNSRIKYNYFFCPKIFCECFCVMKFLCEFVHVVELFVISTFVKIEKKNNLNSKNVKCQYNYSNCTNISAAKSRFLVEEVYANSTSQMQFLFHYLKDLVLKLEFPFFPDRQIPSQSAHHLDHVKVKRFHVV